MEDEKNNEGKQEKEKESTLVQQLETSKMAFQGDFDKVDDEIKVQLKALLKKDFKTLKRLQRQEMSRDEMKLYVAEGAAKREIEMNMKKFDSEYDTDINRTMYMEFWKDLNI